MIHFKQKNWWRSDLSFQEIMSLPVLAGSTVTGRIKTLILTDMKALVYEITDVQAQSNYRVSLAVAFFDPSNSEIVEVATGIDVPFDTPIQVVDPASFLAACKAKVLAYAVSQSYSLVESDIIWSNPNTSSEPIESALSLSIQTSTGAVGTQVSSTRDAWVTVAGQVSTTANIGGNSNGDIIVEVAPTNSATSGDWIEKGRIGNSQAVTLAIALQSVQIIKGQITVFVPKGYYIKARSSGAGTVSYTIDTVRKVLL